jgi:hypothetical protein
MEEDVLGPRQTLGKRYTTCTECGKVIPRRLVHAGPGSVMEGVHSELAERCPDCETMDLKEPTIPLDPDE